MAKLFDRVGQATATTGTGTLTLGAVITDAFNGDLCTYADMGAVAGDDVNYFIIDGNNFEIGHGVLGGTGPGFTLTRTVAKSKIAGTVGTTALTLTGSAKVFCDAFARMANTWANDIVTSGWVYVKDGAVGIAWGGGGQLLVGGSQVNINDAAGSFAINSDLFLARDAANTFAQKNSTNAQTFRVYGSDGGANYSRLSISHAGGTSGATIGTEKGGTGTAGPLTLAPNGLLVLKSLTGGTAYNDPEILIGGGGHIGMTGYGNNLIFLYDSLSLCGFGPSGMALRNSAQVMWATTSDVTAGFDTGFSRNAAGVVEVNNGTTGTFADLKLRSITHSGGVINNVVAKTSAYTATATDYAIVLTGASSFNITLPTAPTAGTTYIVKNIGSGTRTVVISGGGNFFDTGASSVSLAAIGTSGDAVTVMYTSSGWITIAKS